MSGADGVFKLREVSAPLNFDAGQMAECSDQPHAAVKAYPDLRSSRPVYGMVRFGWQPTEPDSGSVFHFAVDESQGAGRGYDRLFFDLDQDLDLRNDDVIVRRSPASVPAKVGKARSRQEIMFGLLKVPFDMGDAGRRPVEIRPSLVVSERDGEERKGMRFVRTRYYEGDIRIGSQPFKARLGNDYFISGRLDAPVVALVLNRPNVWGPTWVAGDRLMAAHKIGGQFYTFAASPTGDELTVHPYRGDLGAFELGPGGRTLDQLTVSGSLTARDRAVPVGAGTDDYEWKGIWEGARRCEVPVGDYLPSHLSIRFGRLRIAVSQNYHSDGKARDRAGRPLVYGFQIQKDKPFVLDFADKPEVLFASPVKDQRLKLGDELGVKAVLVDTKLDIMIHNLDDTTRKQTKDAHGKALGYERNLSLDPTVLITRANGERMAEGVMPFG